MGSCLSGPNSAAVEQVQPAARHKQLSNVGLDRRGSHGSTASGGSGTHLTAALSPASLKTNNTPTNTTPTNTTPTNTACTTSPMQSEAAPLEMPCIPEKPSRSLSVVVATQPRSQTTSCRQEPEFDDLEVPDPEAAKKNQQQSLSEGPHAVQESPAIPCSPENPSLPEGPRAAEDCPEIPPEEDPCASYQSLLLSASESTSRERVPEMRERPETSCSTADANATTTTQERALAASEGQESTASEEQAAAESGEQAATESGEQATESDELHMVEQRPEIPRPILLVSSSGPSNQSSREISSVTGRSNSVGLAAPGAKEMVTSVKLALDAWSLVYEEVPLEKLNNPNIRIIKFELGTTYTRCTVVLTVDLEDEIFSVYTCSLIKAVQPRFREIARYFAAVNYGLMLGHFDLDFRDGEIRFKLSEIVRETRLSQEMVHQMLGISLKAVDKHLPGLMACQFGNMSAEDALQETQWLADQANCPQAADAQ